MWKALIRDKGIAKCIWPLCGKSIGIPEDDVKQSTKLLKWDVAYTLRQFLPRCRMQTRSSDENSVCLFVRPSVCLSVKRVNYDKKDEKFVHIFILYERSRTVFTAD